MLAPICAVFEVTARNPVMSRRGSSSAPIARRVSVMSSSPTSRPSRLRRRPLSTQVASRDVHAELLVGLSFLSASAIDVVEGDREMQVTLPTAAAAPCSDDTASRTSASSPDALRERSPKSR